MPVVINFTLDPLRSWLKYRSEDNKASSDAYLERALANEASTTATVVTKAPGQRARIDVVSTSGAAAQAIPTATREQVELAARLRQDVLLTSGARDRSDGEDR